MESQEKEKYTQEPSKYNREDRERIYNKWGVGQRDSQNRLIWATESEWRKNGTS